MFISTVQSGNTKIRGPNVGFISPALAALMDQYQLIRDVIAGEVAVKEQGELYLPRPAPSDNSAENMATYLNYKKRAQFFPAARLTLDALVAQVFMRPPEIYVPDSMDIILKNATGSGVSLELQAKRAFEYAMAYSRGGVYTDYPYTEGYTSVADAEKGRIRPTINVVDPMNIINWQLREIGAEEVLSLVVIAEQYCDYASDGFEVAMVPRWRVLGLDENNFYYQELYVAKRKPSKGMRGVYELERERIYPRDGNDQLMSFIPFTFFGSDNNDPNPDMPVFYGLCSLTLGWYRNSADFEQALFMGGQPTLVITGVDQQWQKDNAGVARLGTAGGLALPTNATADFLQAETNNLPKEGMEQKQKLMIAAGARLVEDRSIQRTATEVSIENASSNSILASVARNVSEAIENALRWAAVFKREDPEQIVFKLNADFDISKITPEARRMLLEEWQKGAITFEEYRAILTKHGIATEDARIARAKIDQDLTDAAMDLGDPLVE